MPALRTRDTHPSAARSLEVSTGAPPPSLTIISPTPRAFTFPIAHNLADSPYSSPSNSPFEPDLRALALSAPSTPSSSIDSHHPHDECRSPPPLSAFTRTLSPAAAAAEPSPASTSSAPPRRKSTSSAAGAPEERRPKKGDEDYVKRPENAFILFRRKCCEDRALGLASTSTSAPSSLASGPSSADSPALAGNNGKKQRQADLSKTISQQWKALAPEERAHWEALAKEKKREHETLHPNYVYRPQRSGAKNRSAAAAAASPSMTTTTTTGARRKNSAPPQQVEFVVPAPRGAQHGRSASAPTPPPYQAIQIPNVYFGNGNGNAPLGAEGDSPTSLMPMISRRGVGNGQGGFDYLPSNSGFASFDFEASLQSSDFLRAMFPPSSTGGSIMSPASSASGSGPSSPYTPASASFHPSAFSSPSPLPASYIPHPSSASHSFTQSLEAASYAAHDDLSSFGVGLGLGLEPAAPISHPASYASYASAWAASSPWAAAGPASAMAEGDFDIGRIPEIGWEMGGCGASSSSPSFGYREGLGQGGDAYEGHGHGEGGYECGGEGEGECDGADADDAMGMGMGMDFGELDLGAGMEMGFDEMMAGSGF